MPLDAIRPLTDFPTVRSTGRMTNPLAGFASLAATLAAVGIYGVMSLYVANRGVNSIRLAAGAEPRNLIRPVLGEGLVLILDWARVLGALLGTRWIRVSCSTSATDPIVFCSSLSRSARLPSSCYRPSRREERSDAGDANGLKPLSRVILSRSEAQVKDRFQSKAVQQPRLDSDPSVADRFAPAPSG
jgi:hypothetical protein